MPSKPIYENVIEFDAILEYHASFIIQRLISQLSDCYLVRSPNVEVALAVTDESKVFPPLLEYVKEQHGAD
jgi:hypothetical protein